MSKWKAGVRSFLLRAHFLPPLMRSPSPSQGIPNVYTPSPRGLGSATAWVTHEIMAPNDNHLYIVLKHDCMDFIRVVVYLRQQFKRIEIAI